MPKIRFFDPMMHTLFRQGIKTLIAAESRLWKGRGGANGTDAVTRAAEPGPICIDGL